MSDFDCNLLESSFFGEYLSQDRHSGHVVRSEHHLTLPTALVTTSVLRHTHTHTHTHTPVQDSQLGVDEG